MSVLIKGMEMPKNCMECELRFIARGLDTECIFSNDTVDDCTDRRLYRCPLIEVPTPHGRLIDADANVGSYVETWTCNCSEFGTQIVMAVDDLKYLPTIIEAEEKSMIYTR